MPRRNPTQPGAMARALGLAAGQGGVCTVGQLRDAGLTEATIRRQLEGGAWQRLHRGVHLLTPAVDPLQTRTWAAHLAVGPHSIVAGPAAAEYWGVADADPGSAVQLLIPGHLRSRVPGVDVRRVPDPQRWAHPARVPPVLTIEHTIIDMAQLARTDAAAADVLLRACRQRLTTPDRIVAALGGHPRLRRRALLVSLCEEVRDGVTSPLERLYRSRVERAHRLPLGTRQAAAQGLDGHRIYRDVRYGRYRVLVELDGHLGHEDEQGRLADQLRDNAARLDGELTLRFGWLAVTGDACLAAHQVIRALRAGGWGGTPRACALGCRVTDQLPTAA